MPVAIIFGRISRLFGSGEKSRATEISGLGIGEIEKVGTPEDPLRDYEEALKRNFHANGPEVGAEESYEARCRHCHEVQGIVLWCRALAAGVRSPKVIFLRYMEGNFG